MLSAKDITNLFLYGQRLTPIDLSDDKLIRPISAEGSVDINLQEFMKNGAGRFAIGSQFEIIQKFFESDVPPRDIAYTKQEIANIFGLDFFGWDMQQRIGRMGGTGTGSDPTAYPEHVDLQTWIEVDGKIVNVSPNVLQQQLTCNLTKKLGDSFINIVEYSLGIQPGTIQDNWKILECAHSGKPPVMVAWVDARKPADKVIVEALDLRESFWSWVSSLNPRYHYCTVEL
jgi:hypothetical protein